MPSVAEDDEIGESTKTLIALPNQHLTTSGSAAVEYEEKTVESPNKAPPASTPTVSPTDNITEDCLLYLSDNIKPT